MLINLNILFIISFFALIGFWNTAISAAKLTYRWSGAIDELLKQRKERKNKK
jgi:hypothetical protein